MKLRRYVPRLATLRRLCLLCGLIAALAIVAGGAPGQSPASAQDPVPQASPPGNAFTTATTLRYVVTFYPRWFTYNQANHATINRLIGPDRMAPVFHEVVAPNDDTLYVSSFLDLTDQPVIVTVPQTTVTYSLLTVDVYGNVFSTGIETPGIYALTGPGWAGALPAGVTPAPVPVTFLNFLFRADKFSPTGENQIAAAEQFRTSLRLATLSEYLGDSSAGVAAIAPVALYATPWKGLADDLIAHDAIEFLKQLQTAVEASTTPPLSLSEQLLANTFNRLFGNGNFNSGFIGRARKSDFILGAQSAHARIVNHYLSHRGPTNWITFANIGEWGRQYLDRASITEFIQYGNNHSEAAYYHTFKDRRGRALDASIASGYVLTFTKRQLPEAERFWALTAYLPGSITLVDNAANKYVVASYTPGLVTSPDGSVSIYMSPEPPPGVPEANWLPVPRGPFNVMLRVYGPEGKVKHNTYVPPGIRAVD